MFDPTIYENIKVVIEGAVYDLDLAGSILITDRVDRIELSTMSRFYSIQFQELDYTSEENPKAEIRIQASIEDLAAEILEKKAFTPGCYVEVFFICKINHIETECVEIERLLQEIWDSRPSIQQKLSFLFSSRNDIYENEIRLQFNRKIDEAQIEDIKPLIERTYQSILRLNEYYN